MARLLTPKDAHALMNSLVHQATGQQAITVTDTSSFISAGELVLSTGMENVFNSLNIVLNGNIIAARPYKARLKSIMAANSGVYSNRKRKISFYSDDMIASGMFNTDLFTNLKDGFTAGENKDSQGDPQSTKSQWEQKQKPILESNFGGSSVWDYEVTLYEKQVQAAFRNESEFNSFISGYLIEHSNDIESAKEAWNRMILVSKIAQTYAMSAVMPGSVVNLTAEFNNRFGTSYTSAQLRSTYLKEYLPFMVATIKEKSTDMTERSSAFHYTPSKPGHSLLRHTPYADQRLYLYSRLFKEAEALVLPQIFNAKGLDLDKQYEEVTFWQSNNSEAERSQIKIKPAVINPATGQQEAAANDVELAYVVGMLTDKDSMMTDIQLESAYTTAIEARKGYRNTWNHFMRNAICDPTENTIIFIMAD